MDVTPLDPVLVIIGLLLPLVVSVAKQTGWGDRTNSIVAIIVYIVAAGLWLVYNHVPITLEDITANAVVLTTIGLMAYKMFYKALGIDPVVTEKTSIVTPK